MANEKRNMTARGFLAKANSAKSAQAFFEAHKEYILTGEIAPLTAPIFGAFEKGAMLPTVALLTMKQAVVAHIMLAATTAAKEAAAKPPKAPAKSGLPYRVEVLDAEGDIVMGDNGDILLNFFEKWQDAERWLDRKLFDAGPACHGEITHTYHVNGDRRIKVHPIMRDDSIARVLHKGPQGAFKSLKFGGSKLGFGVKAKNDVSKFSRG